MSTYRQFIFKDYNFKKDVNILTLRYSLDGQLNFTETYTFAFDSVDTPNDAALDRACNLLFLLAGVSYYKTYIPPEIVVKKGSVDASLKSFLDKTYQKGLGEFFYVNKLDPQNPINFPITSDELGQVSSPGAGGQLIGIGGGKDSLVTAELLKNQPKVATWSMNHQTQLEPLVTKIGLPHFYVEREWDKQLLELNTQGAYNGHVPLSAILAAVGSIVAVLTGYQDVVVSNESSASEPNLHYQGVAINHQYSKSLEFETDFQAILTQSFGDNVQYYSFLRPLTELRIAELFAQIGFEKYQSVFSSCNRAFTHDSHHMFWCGECPKCAFVFLALTPFVERTKLETLFHGKNLLLDSSLESTYRALLGIEGDKPLECVGEVKESRAAMKLAQTTYPELTKYQFELPDNYDFRALSTHAMPTELFAALRAAL